MVRNKQGREIKRQSEGEREISCPLALEFSEGELSALLASCEFYGSSTTLPDTK